MTPPWTGEDGRAEAERRPQLQVFHKMRAKWLLEFEDTIKNNVGGG